MKVVEGKRAQPRVAFGQLLEAGLLKPGAELCDAKRRWTATVRVDGSLEVMSGDKKGTTGSIHKAGALVQDFDACNGWTFWHVIGKDGELQVIDDLRSIIRAEIAA